MRRKLEAVNESERRELRQVYAGQAMQGMIAMYMEAAIQAGGGKTAGFCEELAKFSVMMADAMVTELEKE